MPAISSDGLPVQRGRLGPSHRSVSGPGCGGRRPPRRDGESNAMSRRSTRRTGSPRWSGGPSGRRPGASARGGPSRRAARARRGRRSPAPPGRRPRPTRSREGPTSRGASARSGVNPQAEPRRIAPGPPAASAEWSQSAEGVAKCRSQPPTSDLGIDQDQRQAPAAAQAVGIRGPAGAGVPVPSREDAEGDQQAEERLARAPVHGRQQRRDPGHPQAAQHALADHRGQRQHAQPLHPPPRLERQQAARQDDRRQPDRRPVEPVDVLDPHAERGVPEIVEEHVLLERGRPVGHGHARRGTS